MIRILPLIIIYGRDKRPEDPPHYVFSDKPPGVGTIHRPRPKS